VPPVDEDELPPEDELEEEELELDELELLLDVLPDEPKLLEPPVAPELVELLDEEEEDEDEEALLDEAELELPPELPELPPP
jgi:hypothetical protein